MGVVPRAWWVAMISGLQSVIGGKILAMPKPRNMPVKRNARGRAIMSDKASPSSFRFSSNIVIGEAISTIHGKEVAVT